ncbi:hypothetical protein N7490_008680 [Penicillium lividum]|nr:hypothetical protein N7490_008680 [Penicillium lividum]
MANKRLDARVRPKLRRTKEEKEKTEMQEQEQEPQTPTTDMVRIRKESNRLESNQERNPNISRVERR